MRISSVGNYSTVSNYQPILQPKRTEQPKPVAFTSSHPFFDYGQSLIHIYQINKLKEETKEFPQDIAYREQLLKNAGLNPLNQHKIRSIIGPQEIKKIIKTYDDKPEAFSIGDNWENVNNRTMRANLHMHTKASDGRLTVTELLDKATEYANKVKSENPKIKEPFVVAITDHDTTEGANEAIRIISENPVKYKNLRVILGAEISTFNNVAPDIVNKPTNTHVLVYGIDPNEPKFKGFLESVKAKKYHIQEMMTETANETYKKHFGKEDFYNIPQAKQQYTTINKNIVGTYNAMDAYFKTKAVVDEVVLKDRKLTNALKKHNIPADTDIIMERLSEFRHPIDNNNKTYPPEQTLPEFIYGVTGMDKDVVSQRLEKGLKSERFMSFSEDLKTGVQEYKVTFTPKYDYMPTFETLYDGLKNQKNAIVGIAHPLDGVSSITKPEDKYSFLEDFYTKFKEGCKEKAKFTEAYYQSYKQDLKEFNENPKTQEFFKNLKKVFKILRTGSADTHGVNVFIR